MLERRPEWRIPPPPFKGPHTEASKTKNRLSNIGKRRSPDFGPRIGQIMVEIWKRGDYRKKREGKKRETPSRKTREKIRRSLERRWRKDLAYQLRMLLARNSTEFRDRSREHFRKLWREFPEQMLKIARETHKNGHKKKKERREKDGFDERDHWLNVWRSLRTRGILSNSLSNAEIVILDDFFERKRREIRRIDVLLDKFTKVAANLS